MIRLKRIWEPPSDQDGYRILVDRMWPRGISKDKAHLDRWARELSPSVELCKFFDHDPVKWADFQKRYQVELESKSDMLSAIADQAAQGVVTLLYAAKDECHNQAVVLKKVIEDQHS